MCVCVSVYLYELPLFGIYARACRVCALSLSFRAWQIGWDFYDAPCLVADIDSPIPICLLGRDSCRRSVASGSAGSLTRLVG